MKKIDLAELGGPVYIGRNKGKRARDKYGLDEIDNTKEIVKILIPQNAYSINSSFFLGLLGESIRKAGSKEAFLEKFHFVNDENHKETIEECISRALFEKKPLI